jgi:hypothetical protein
MPEKMEKLIKAVYRKWKAGQSAALKEHPGEEDLACLAEGRLSTREAEGVKSHLVICEGCSRKFSLYAKLQLLPEKQLQVPAELTERLKDLLAQNLGNPALEIFLRFKEKILELVSTTGDVLIGRELVPAPLLRTRKIRDFKDEINIFKDFQGIRVEIKIEKKSSGNFNLAVLAREKPTQKVLRDIRITLIRDSVELESYLSDAGGVTFENILLGKYRIQISDIEKRLASVILDVRV